MKRLMFPAIIGLAFGAIIGQAAFAIYEHCTRPAESAQRGRE